MGWQDCKQMGKLPSGIMHYIFLFEAFGFGILLVRKKRKAQQAREEGK